MFILKSIVYLYAAVLMFRQVATKQELMLKPAGRFVAKLTDFLFKNKKNNIANMYAFILLLLFSLISAALSLYGQQTYVNIKSGFAGNLISSIFECLLFLMAFYIISLIVGSYGNRFSYDSGVGAFFFRIGLPWVNLTRVFIKINSGKIVFPAMIFVYLFFLSVIFLTSFVFNVILGDYNVFQILKSSFIVSMKGLDYILIFFYFVIIAQVIISLFSPDYHNVFYNFLFVTTEPVLEPIRKVVKPIGIFDLSPLVAILIMSFLSLIINGIIK